MEEETGIEDSRKPVEMGEMMQVANESPVDLSEPIQVVPVKRCVNCKELKLQNDFPNKKTNWCRECIDGVKKKSKVDTEDIKWSKYMNQLYLDSIKPGAPAATRDLYAVLVGKKVERKEILLGLNADEIARRNLMAQKALQDELGKEIERKNPQS